VTNLLLHGARHFGEHGLFAGFDQFPLTQVEVVLLDDFLQRGVRWRAGADAVDLLVELVGELVQVGKVMHTASHT
jgi:hypothetical protein